MMLPRSRLCFLVPTRTGRRKKETPAAAAAVPAFAMLNSNDKIGGTSSQLLGGTFVRTEGEEPEKTVMHTKNVSRTLSVKKGRPFHGRNPGFMRLALPV